MGSISRRTFIRAAGAVAGSAVLGACAPSRTRRVAIPGSLPIHGDNLPIDAATRVERGATLRIYQWRDYLARDVLDGFARRHAASDVEVEVESFTTMAQAVERLRRSDADFDVFFPTTDALPRLVAERLVLPLTHELLPNTTNLWPYFRTDTGPFYDVGQRYSVPYTVYSTGIGWRRDLVRDADAPEYLSNPYDAYWNERYRGAVGIYDDYREAMAMALLRRREDPNTGEERVIERAVEDLVSLAEGVNVEVSAEGAYHELQTGEYAFQQSWSGDLLSAKRFGAARSRRCRPRRLHVASRRHRRLRSDGDLRPGAQPLPRPRIPRSPDGCRGRDAELPLERLPAPGGERDTDSPRVPAGCDPPPRRSHRGAVPAAARAGSATPGGAWDGNASSRSSGASRPRPSTCRCRHSR